MGDTYANIIWITPNMFSPEALNGGGAFDYFRDTMRHVGRYAQQRGIALDLLNGVNVAIQAGTRLDTLQLFRDLPVYTYLSPNRPEQEALSMRLCDYWTKAIPEVGIWSLFPGDPGGCMEEGCPPGTYVDLSLEVARIIKKNNPKAKVDFTTWHFFGRGPDFTYYEYNKNHLVHTWSYFVTEGEIWSLSRLSEVILWTRQGHALRINPWGTEPVDRMTTIGETAA